MAPKTPPERLPYATALATAKEALTPAGIKVTATNPRPRESIPTVNRAW